MKCYFCKEKSETYSFVDYLQITRWLDLGGFKSHYFMELSGFKYS